MLCAVNEAVVLDQRGIFPCAVPCDCRLNVRIGIHSRTKLDPDTAQRSATIEVEVHHVFELIASYRHTIAGIHGDLVCILCDHMRQLELDADRAILDLVVVHGLSLIHI